MRARPPGRQISAGAAAQTSPWYLGASLALTHEDNVYRLPDGVATPAGVSKADTITTASLLAGLDQPIGRQRLYGTASLRDNRFDRNRVLDNQGYALRAGLDWATGERIAGTLDLRAEWSATRDWTLGLKLNNALDQHYQTSLGYDQPRRGVFVNARYTLK